MTIADPSGRTTTTKSSGFRPSVFSANAGPRTPSTPTSEAVDAR